MKMKAKASSNQPSRKLPAALARQNHEIEFPIVRASLPGQVDPPRILTTIGHHGEASNAFRHHSTVYLDLHEWWLEITKLSERGAEIREVADRTGANAGQIMDHLRIESKGRHEHHDFVRTALDHRPPEVDPVNLPIDQILHHRGGIGGHSIVTGKEILITRWTMNERHVGSDGLGDGKADRTVPADHDQGIPTLQRPSKPRLCGSRSGGQQVDFQTSGRGGRLNPLRDHAGSARP